MNEQNNPGHASGGAGQNMHGMNQAQMGQGQMGQGQAAAYPPPPHGQSHAQFGYPPPYPYYPPWAMPQWPGYPPAATPPYPPPAAAMHGHPHHHPHLHANHAQPPGAAMGGPGMAQVMQELANGGSGGLASLTRLLDLDDKDFWKGALVGAAAVLLLTNESVQRALFRGAVKGRDAVDDGVDKVKAGVEKVKQRFDSVKESGDE
jgi:hypothetical protein